MKKFTYPAVVYYDEDNQIYVMYIGELGLVAEGETVEEARRYLTIYLREYIITSLRFGLPLTEPASYEELKKKNNDKNIVFLDAVFEDKEYAKAQKNS